MRGVRIPNGSVNLYLKIIKILEREGIEYEEKNRRCLNRTIGGEYAFDNDSYRSLDSALQRIKKTHGIQAWYVVEKDGAIPIVLREVEDEILTANTGGLE